MEAGLLNQLLHKQHLSSITRASSDSNIAQSQGVHHDFAQLLVHIKPPHDGCHFIYSLFKANCSVQYCHHAWQQAICCISIYSSLKSELIEKRKNTQTVVSKPPSFFVHLKYLLSVNQVKKVTGSGKKSTSFFKCDTNLTAEQQNISLHSVHQQFLKKHFWAIMFRDIVTTFQLQSPSQMPLKSSVCTHDRCHWLYFLLEITMNASINR